MITGSRKWTDKEALFDFLDQVIKDWGKPDLFIHGGAAGADIMGHEWAASRGIKSEFVRFLPDWDKYGKGAGHIRNQLMVDEATHAVAFPWATSRGTQDAMNRIEEKGIPLRVNGAYCEMSGHWGDDNFFEFDRCVTCHVRLEG